MSQNYFSSYSTMATYLTSSTYSLPWREAVARQDELVIPPAALKDMATKNFTTCLGEMTPEELRAVQMRLEAELAQRPPEDTTQSVRVKTSRRIWA